MKFTNMERKEGDLALDAIQKATAITVSHEWTDEDFLSLFHESFLISVDEVCRETRKRKFLLEKSVATYDYETGFSAGDYEDVGFYARIEDAILEALKLWIRQDVDNALEGAFWEEHGRECAKLARNSGMTDQQVYQTVREGQS